MNEKITLFGLNIEKFSKIIVIYFLVFIQSTRRQIFRNV